MASFNRVDIGHGKAGTVYPRKCFKPTQPRMNRRGVAWTRASQAPELTHERVEVNGKVPVGRRPQSPFHTGSTDITTSGTASLVSSPLVQEKQIVLVRHGLTTWNEAKRIQGDSDGAVLTEYGESQARRCRDALSQIPFDSCFASPIKRGWRFAELIWADRKGPLIPLDTLKEAHLGWLQGMKQVEAAEQHEAVFRAWREQPHDFEIDGRHPVDEVFAAAKSAWEEMLLAEGSSHLVVTHKSILRALLCVAMGLPKTAFRAVDVNNGGVTVFRVNKRGEPMLINMNQTAHMHADGVFY